MKNHESPPSYVDPMIINLEAARLANARPDDTPPEPTDGNDPKGTETFWSGRNLAMRRSARWVA